MNFKKTSVALAWVTLTAVATPTAFAEVTGWYGGASVGPTKASIDNARISSNLLSSGFSAVSITDDGHSAGYKIFGGYQFNRNFALESGYFDLGKFGFSATTVPAGSLQGEIKIKGLNLDLVGTLPITEKFSALARVGANYAQTSDTISGTGAVVVNDRNPRKRDTNLKFGLGVQYAFNNSLSLRAEIERYRINDAVGNKGDVDKVSFGLVYHFESPTSAPVMGMGMGMPSPVRVALEPLELAVPAPPPTPAFVSPMTVNLFVDSLSELNKANAAPTRRETQQNLPPT